MRVERNIESVVAVLGNIEHARAEVLGARGGLLEEKLQNRFGRGIFYGIERFHESSDGRRVDGISKTSRPLNEGILTGH